MSTPQVILYDLPSRQGTSWSLNPWKTRLVLNFKGIDYKTQWVEYPDLAETFKSLGITPNDPNSPGYYCDYSSPAIKYADGTYAMDSWPIAHALEKAYPEPPLHLDNPIVVQVRDLIAELILPLRPHTHPKVPARILNPRSAEYFYKTREKRFGVSLPEMERTQADDECWVKAEGPARKAGDLLRKNGGPFFLGETVSYADFIFVAWLRFLVAGDEGMFQRYLALDPAFPKVYAATEKWLARDD